MLLAFKPLLHNPFLWKERKINSIIAVIVLLVIASLVVPYLPLYHSALPHPERNIPCGADLLLPYIRLSSVLLFLQSLPCARVFHLSLYTAFFLTAIGMRYYHVPIAHRLLQTNFLLLSSHFISFFLMLTYSFIADYQEFNLRYKDNTTRDKNETNVGKQSANQFHEALHGDLTKRFLSCWRSASLECNEALH